MCICVKNWVFGLGSEVSSVVVGSCSHCAEVYTGELSGRSWRGDDHQMHVRDFEKSAMLDGCTLEFCSAGRMHQIEA